MKTSRNSVLATLACMLAAGSAFAAETPAATAIRTITVSYGDLDLARPAGAAALYARRSTPERRVPPMSSRS